MNLKKAAKKSRTAELLDFQTVFPNSAIPLSAAFLLLASPLLNAQTPAQLEQMLEESSGQHIREELGVNPITAPAIRNLLPQLEQFRPIPLELIAQNKTDLSFSNRMQTAIHFGTMVADGFMLALAERSSDVETIGKALLRQAHNLGVGDRLNRRSKSLLEKSSRGDWQGMREELVQTQADVEDAMMELHDEEIAHFISLGGWLRGFQLAATSTAQNYHPNRAQALVNDPVMEYFIERLSTIHPRMRTTELVSGLITKLSALRETCRQTEGRSPSKEEVEKMRSLSSEAFLLCVSPVDKEGKIIGPPMINSPK